MALLPFEAPSPYPIHGDIETSIAWQPWGLMSLWGFGLYKIKLVHLSFVNVIIRPAEEAKRVEKKIFCPNTTEGK